MRSPTDVAGRIAGQADLTYNKQGPLPLCLAKRLFGSTVALSKNFLAWQVEHPPVSSCCSTESRQRKLGYSEGFNKSVMFVSWSRIDNTGGYPEASRRSGVGG